MDKEHNDTTNISPKAFDENFNDNDLNLYKIIYFYVASPYNKGLALWIKLKEITNILNTPILSKLPQNPQPNIINILEQTLQYVTNAQKDKITQVIQILEKYQQIQDMLTLISVINTDSTEAENIMDLFSNLDLNYSNLNDDILKNLDLNNLDIDLFSEILK